MSFTYRSKINRSGISFIYLFLFTLIMGFSKTAKAQCPVNIDFELGDFTNWKCWVGTHYILPSSKDTIDVGTIPVAPIPGRHAMLSAVPGNGIDPYGLFPKNCPNGSGHSIQLGNTTTAGSSIAQGVSYTFTIPAGQNEFSLIYHYAVIVQESVATPHTDPQQASLTIEVKNLSDNTLLGCSSFSFHATSGVPGFFPSTVNFNVKCKDWAASTINLDGMAGKTVQIFFKTATCTFGGHFGYAYVDVNPECSSSFVGATFCPDDTAINVTAPYGYQNYTWFNSGYTQILGNTQILHLNPPPLSGSVVHVEVVPYSGYGCVDTLTANLLDTLTIQPYAGKDTALCLGSGAVQLGAPPVLGLVYKWVPAIGLSNPDISNPIANVTASTQYVLFVSHDGGGCLTTDTVNVDLIQYDTTLQVTGPLAQCSAGSVPVVLTVPPGADSIQWYRNGVAIPGANQVQYTVTQSGIYYASLISFAGCSFDTRMQQIDIFQTPVADFSVNNPDQCFNAHSFIFVNASTPPSGTPVYRWDMGDGTIINTANVVYSYATPGTYLVNFSITGDGACTSSKSITIHIYPSPKAGFKVNTPNQCFKNNFFVFTDTSSISAGALQYHWDLGDGTLATSQNISHSYAAPGIYTVSLRTDATGVCTDQFITTVTVYPSPIASFSVNALNQCFVGHQFILTNGSTPAGAAYLWTMGDGNQYSITDVNHSYTLPGAYTIKLRVTTTDGCLDSTSTNVNVYPMPTADFLVQPICTDLTVPLINKTINNTISTMNYFWDLGNGQLSGVRSPSYSYSAPGTYTITLSVNTVQCPAPLSTKQLNIVVDAPLPGIRYPDKDAVMFFPEPLEARIFGNTVLWKPATSLDFKTSYKPTFRGRDPQLYFIELRTNTGCLTVDTQLVKTHKKIEIYVPSGFTPNGNGVNDYLRPILMGFEKVNYFRIYDRWGKLLFEMKSDRPGWDGKTGNTPQEMQSVVWMIEAVDVDGVVHHKQGTTVIIR